MLEDDEGGAYDPKHQRYRESVASSSNVKSSVHDSIKKFKDSLKNSVLQQQ